MIMFERIKGLFGGNSGMSRNRGYQGIAPYIAPEDLPNPVTFDSSLSISAVWQAIRLQSENVASLPLKFYKTDDGQRVEDDSTDIAKLFNGGKINRYQDKISFFESIVVNLVSWGNSYCLIQRNAPGSLIGLLPLSADQMEVELKTDGSVLYHFSDSVGIKTYSSRDIWHIKLFGNGIEGLSPLGYARQTLGIAQAANSRTGKTFRNAGKRTGVFSVDTSMTQDGDLSQEQKDGIRREYGKLAQGDEDFLPVLPVGINFEPLSMTAADQQLLENRKFSVVEISRIFNIPSILLHSTGDTTTLGSSTSEIINSYYKLSLRPLLTKIEESIRITFMSPAERKRITAHFNLDDLMRPLPAERWANHKTAIESGAMSPNEVRKIENLPRIEGVGDELLANSALKPVRDIERGQVAEKNTIRESE